MSLLPYVFRRLGWAAVTLLGVTILTYVLVYRIPADPAAVLAGPAGSADPEVLAAIRSRLELDRPPWEQYARFLGRLLRGDLGESHMTGAPVARTILERLPATALLAVSGWLVWLLLGSLIGAVVAGKPTSVRETALLCFSVAGMSTPSFWVGVLLLYLFVSRLRWFPAGGSGTIRHLVLPLVTLAVAGVGYYARLVYAGTTAALAQDYCRAALARGLSPRQVLWNHAFRNALLPLVTLAGADLAALLGGVVFTESVFGWNGIGRLAVDAVRFPDLPVVVGIVLFSAVAVSTANLATDLLYPVLDPRVRLR
jgi:peptide/nickel transport system permease protein